MKRFLTALFLLPMALFAFPAKSAPVVISTDHTTLVLEAEKGQAPKFAYYGARLDEAEVASVVQSSLNFRQNAFPVFGADMMTGVAMQVIHADGNPTLDLAVTSVETSASKDGKKVVITTEDRHYPFTVKLCFETREKADVIEQWTEISHTEKKMVELARFDSAFMPILSVAEGARPLDLEGKVFSGAVLMHTGVELNLGREYGSRVLELVEIN